MLKIERKFCINSWDIEREWPEADFDVCSMPFAEGAENDSYVSFYMGIDHLDELHEMKTMWCHNERMMKCINDEIALMYNFYDLGFKENDEILIRVSW